MKEDTGLSTADIRVSALSARSGAIFLFTRRQATTSCVINQFTTNMLFVSGFSSSFAQHKCGTRQLFFASSTEVT
jgi:hypothetical protein